MSPHQDVCDSRTVMWNGFCMWFRISGSVGRTRFGIADGNNAEVGVVDNCNNNILIIMSIY